MTSPLLPSATRAPARGARRRPRRRLLALLAAGAVAGPALLATTAASAAIPVPRPLPGPVPVPAPGPCRLTDFRVATVDPLVSADPAATKHRLTVMGTLPVPAKVTLQPVVYIRQPEHWAIEVIACPVWTAGPVLPRPDLGVQATQAGVTLPVMPPSLFYKTTFDFTGTLGSCGIEVVGATTHQTFDLAGPKGCGEIGPAA